MSTFFICATPIGNLSDVSQRLTETLKEVDVIYCEDTRRAAKLLNHLGIKKETRSYFLGNEVQKIEEIKNLLKSKKDIALISDAGTPLISDPGSFLIKHLVQEKFNIVSIPGPSSVLTALTISGFEINEFQFLGFIPKSQKEKLEFIVKLFNSSMPTVCYTSPNRIKKDLDFFDSQGLDSELVICRELTKKFETIYRGKASELKHQFESDVKGEITIVIGPSSSQNEIILDLDEAIKILIKNNVSKKNISKALSLVTEYSVNDLYNKIKDF